jgi:hypothetical protein
LLVALGFLMASGPDGRAGAAGDDSQWWGFGTPAEYGLPDGVAQFVAFGGRLVAVGSFFQSAGMHCVGTWTGAEWELLGQGVYMRHPAEPLPCSLSCSPWIASAVVYDGDLVVGGGFRYAGGYFQRHRANNVARWDGTNWSAIGAGLGGPVRALALYGTDLIAIYSTIDSVGWWHSRFARWDGFSWQSMDEGFIGAPLDLVVKSEELYALSDRLFRWTGSSWVIVSEAKILPWRLGVYRDSIVARIEVVENGITRRRIAAWAGGDWIPIGGRLASEIGHPDCFAEVDGHLFVGGSLPAFNNIAEWTGSGWESLGSGVGPGEWPHVSYPVAAIYEYEERIFVGGMFIAAGHKPSWHIARWDPRRTPVAIEGFEARAIDGGVLLSWRLARETLEEIAGVDVERAEEEAGPFVTRTAVPLAPGLDMSFLDQGDGFGIVWYRLRVRGTTGDVHLSPVLRVVVDSPSGATTLSASTPFPGQPVVIRYRLAQSSPAMALDVFTITGRLVRSLDRGARPAGEHLVEWDRRTSQGEQVARGVYFIRLRADRVVAEKVVVAQR